MILNIEAAERLNNFKLTEDNVEDYIVLAHAVFKENKKLYETTEVPKNFDSPLDAKMWRREEIRRCIQGHNGLCGKMYFYINYVYIKNISGGFIKPEYRVCDHAWFELIESTRPKGKNKGKGVICVKRRRAGFSWKAAADALHDAMFTKGAEIGMDSKSEVDSQHLFKKCKQIYDRVPEFMRVPVDGGQTKESMYFARKSKDEHGNNILKGNLSELFCLAPTDSAYEGRMMTKWVSDEGGKKPNLLTMWGYTEDCLMQESERLGQFICFGTSGDVDSSSKGLKEFWYKNNAYEFIRFFMAGWMGTSVDKYGNDNIRKEVERILKKRRTKLEMGASDYWDYIQKYPLTPAEAFLAKEGTGVGHVRNIKEQMDELLRSPAKPRKGRFRWGGSGEPKVVFEPVEIPDDGGYVILYQNPIPEFEYASGSDPVDHDYVQGGSDASIYIMNRPKGLNNPPVICMSYTGRPNRADTFYEQSAMALMYYNDTKCLIERNRNGMIKWFEMNGYLHLLKNEPIPKGTLKRSFIPKLGVMKTTANGIELERCINDYTTEYCSHIQEIELLEEFFKYDDENTDRAIAFGWTLYSLEDDLIMKRDSTSRKNLSPKFGIKRINGKVVRYNGK